MWDPKKLSDKVEPPPIPKARRFVVPPMSHSPESAEQVIARLRAGLHSHLPGQCCRCGDSLNSSRPTMSSLTNTPDGKRVVRQHWHEDCWYRHASEGAARS